VYDIKSVYSRGGQFGWKQIRFDLIQKNFDSIRFTGSGVGTGRKGEGAVVHPKFLAVKKLSENHVRKRLSKNAKIQLKTSFSGTSVRILLKIWSVWRKIATSGSVYFANLWRRCSLVNFDEFFHEFWVGVWEYIIEAVGYYCTILSPVDQPLIINGKLLIKKKSRHGREV